ncbi:hypothetical protein OA93_15400 [Flavobacterium sp. KMS]|uniref:hypothetical protein n=1 Tax=Flavobacterium sp. KMS TaxID=1566023 RepID=UPI00057C88B2|nr:hypothetical protein [Flavobacterium sp. KMS]KIA97309.1 hypothetical protein OA93_15400 [Flavobacterium sp. KMS]
MPFPSGLKPKNHTSIFHFRKIPYYIILIIYLGYSQTALNIFLPQPYSQSTVPKVIIMQIEKKVTELLTQKYTSEIAVFASNRDIRRKCILDTDNGTLFTVSDNAIYSYRDKDQNYWVTVPKSFIINQTVHYPVVGDEFTLKNGVKYYFTTKEAVIAIATTYFEKFTDNNYGIKKKFSYLIFLDESCTSKYYAEFKRFKSKTHEKIEAYLSYN